MSRKRPWMPLYIADYRSDTAHLCAAEHGAYLLLIMHYWQTGGLPTEDQQLARITCMTGQEWRKARPTIAPFFDEQWRHKRIDAELERASSIAQSATERARNAANKRWYKHAQSSTASIREAMLGDAQSQSQRKKDAPDGAPNLEKDLFDRGKSLLGNSAGGMISNLLKVKGGNVALARAAIETASTKQNPREYIGRIVNGRGDDDASWTSGIAGVT